MVIRVLDYIENSSSAEEGEKIFRVILPILERKESVAISFEGVGGIPSSFVNTAFVQLLEHFSFSFIAQHISFTSTIKQQNEMIKKRLSFEAKKIEEQK